MKTFEKLPSELSVADHDGLSREMQFRFSVANRETYIPEEYRSEISAAYLAIGSFFNSDGSKPVLMYDQRFGGKKDFELTDQEQIRKHVRQLYQHPRNVVKPNLIGETKPWVDLDKKGRRIGRAARWYLMGVVHVGNMRGAILEAEVTKAVAKRGEKSLQDIDLANVAWVNHQRTSLIVPVSVRKQRVSKLRALALDTNPNDITTFREMLSDLDRNYVSYDYAA